MIVTIEEGDLNSRCHKKINKKTANKLGLNTLSLILKYSLFFKIMHKVYQFGDRTTDDHDDKK